MRGFEGLPEFSKALYKETYFKHGDDYESWSYRVAHKYANDIDHGNRIQSYIKDLVFHPSTPISSDRGLPIACYVSHVSDDNDGIFDAWLEGQNLGALGGGRGVYYGDVGGEGRPIGKYPPTLTWEALQADENIPKSAGIIPFLGVNDRYTYAIKQANVRRSTEAIYIPIEHCDIEAFIDIRLETGDSNRRMPNLHHGIAISNAFMEAVTNLQPWDLVEPHSKLVTKTVDAYSLWMDILATRKMETGEPFLLFIDTVNEDNPIEYTLEGYLVYSSNICTEIVGATAPDLTAVCCLASLNLEQWDEYKDDIEQVVADISDYLSNVLLYTAAQIESMEGKRKQAFQRVYKFITETMEIGIGVMGWHSLLQSKMLPFESVAASALNKQIMKAIKHASDNHQASLPAKSRCGLSKKHGTHRRNLHSIAIAPTMSISTLSGMCSQGVEPWIANSFTKKVPTGSFTVKNKYLDYAMKQYYHKVLQTHSANAMEEWISEQWKSINKHNGSVQHLDWMDQDIKDVFKTAYEIDQRAIISQASDRQKIMTNEQSQSINLFLPAECSYEELYAIHTMAWKEGLKSLYYLRSEPATQADTSTKERQPITLEDDTCVMCT